MIGSLPPGLALIAGALFVPLLRGKQLAVWLLLVPAVSFVHLLAMPLGEYGRFELFDLSLTLVRVDRLSLVFGYIFHLAAFLGFVYALHVEDRVQHAAAMVYAGAATAGLFASNLVTLLVWLEISAVASVFLIWRRGTLRARSAGMRYLVVQIAAGAILLAGVALHFRRTGSIAFAAMKPDTFGTQLILVAFGIKSAFPLLHNWLQDAYPEATPTGTVFLSVFTTKLAIYALARGFPGTSCLVWIGAIMTVFPIFYAVIENDLRRVLAYSLNNQLGFMVVGIGIGTDLAINGAVSHAFAHILYKALLFMSMGAILQQAGTIKASELGGLYKSMPWTTAFCIVGAASISAFPFFSGFVTKSMTLDAAAAGGWQVTSLALLFASAGVLHHSGIRIPFHGFFGHDRGLRCKEAPLNMLIAMGVTAFLCVAIGVYPWPLYGLMPKPVPFQPFTASHIVSQAQLLLFAVLAFALLKRRNLEPPDLAAVNVDSDWAYRRIGPLVWTRAVVPALEAWGRLRGALVAQATRLFAGDVGPDGTGGRVPRQMPISVAVLLTVLALLLYLLLGAR